MPTKRRTPPGFFRRKHGVYYLRWRRGGQDKWMALGRDKEEAIRSAWKISEQFERLEAPIPPRIRAAVAVTEWLEREIAMVRRNPIDRATVQARMRDHVLPVVGGRFLDRISRADCELIRSELVLKDLEIHTQRHVLADLRQFLNWAVDSGYLSRSPFPRRFLPKAPDLPPDRLSPDEEKRVAAIPGQLGFYARFLLATGLRWGEFAEARLCDIDLGGRKMVLPRTKADEFRMVPLPVAVVDEIRANIPAIESRGGRLTHYKETGSFAKAIRKATGLPGFHTHQTRHTYGSRTLDDGMRLEVVSRIMGHASVKQTERYARLSDEVILREAKRVEAAVR